MIARLRHTFLSTGTSCLLASAALAGGPGTELTVVFVTDPDLDRVVRLQDLNEDGDFDDAGDSVLYYDDVQGSIALTSPGAIATDPFDQVFFGDSVEDVILVTRDENEDSDALDAGEARVFFDGRVGGNASGVRMHHVTGLALRILGTLWVTSQGDVAGEPDQVIRLRDLNSDGDANDAGEALVYWVSGPATPLGASAPTSIDIGYDGLVYVLENGPNTIRGIYKLTDFNGSGTIDGIGEIQPYFIPASLPPTADLTSIEIDEAGSWYVLDRASQVVWLGTDTNSNGVIDVATEASQFWSISPAQGCHDMAVTIDGSELYLGDKTAGSDRIVDAKDENFTGDIDLANEVFGVYDDTLADVDIDNPFGLATDFHDHEEVGDAFCTGDSVLCPCANFGNSATGCANSTGVGATLEGTGTDGITNDDLLFEASQLPPNSSALLFSGTAAVNGGLGAVFGDGLRCAGGAVTRMGVQFADPIGFVEFGPGFAAQYGWAVGETLYFQVWYRNNAGPCGSGFNLTNGVQVTFTP